MSKKGSADTTAVRHYKRYPAYKDSGVEWQREIPEHWEMRRLKFLAPSTKEVLDTKLEGTTYVGLENIEAWTGRIILETQPDTLGSAANVFRAGDVLFGKLRPYLAKVARPDFSGISTTEVLALRPVTGYTQSFAMYSLLNKGFIRWLDALTYGAKMPRVNPDQVTNAYMPAPPLSEQKAISDFLDRETAKIDALVGKNERLIELLQEKRTALITRSVTKGLEPKVRIKDSKVEQLGKIPADWEVKRLWHLTPSDRRIMYGIVLPGPDVDSGVPIVKGGDVAAERLRLDRLNRTSAEIESGYKRSRLQGGDLVFAIRGSIGDVAMVPDELEGANLTQDAARIAYTSATHGRWLLYVLKSQEVFAQLEAGALGATIKGINIRDLKRAIIPVPNLNEQVEIATFLDKETAQLDALIAKVQEAIERLKELRIALISAAVTGKIDLRKEVL